jgi:hypothetical protein
MFEEQAFKLLKWFEQHETENGLFISNAHHPIWGVENENVLPHSFHYFSIILSLSISFGYADEDPARHHVDEVTNNI